MNAKLPSFERGDKVLFNDVPYTVEEADYDEEEGHALWLTLTLIPTRGLA